MLFQSQTFVFGDLQEAFQSTEIRNPVTQLPVPIVPIEVGDGWEKALSEKTGPWPNHEVPGVRGAFRRCGVNKRQVYRQPTGRFG